MMPCKRWGIKPGEVGAGQAAIVTPRLSAVSIISCQMLVFDGDAVLAALLGGPVFGFAGEEDLADTGLRARRLYPCDLLLDGLDELVVWKQGLDVDGLEVDAVAGLLALFAGAAGAGEGTRQQLSHDAERKALVADDSAQGQERARGAGRRRRRDRW